MAARLELALACSLQPATQPCQALMITLLLLLLLLRGNSASAGARTASWSEQILQLASMAPPLQASLPQVRQRWR